MPCIAKKHEAALPHMEVDGIRDVDYVLTTRELARLIKRQGIDFARLKDYFPNSALAEYTGAGVIFGTTGGVMEAALRTVKEIVEEKESEVVELSELRNVDENIKEAKVKLGDLEGKVAVVHGAVNFPKMLERIKENLMNISLLNLWLVSVDVSMVEDNQLFRPTFKKSKCEEDYELMPSIRLMNLWM